MYLHVCRERLLLLLLRVENCRECIRRRGSRSRVSVDGGLLRLLIASRHGFSSGNIGHHAGDMGGWEVARVTRLRYFIGRSDCSLS
jgi:hypothetical protein